MVVAQPQGLPPSPLTHKLLRHLDAVIKAGTATTMYKFVVPGAMTGGEVQNCSPDALRYGATISSNGFSFGGGALHTDVSNQHTRIAYDLGLTYGAGAYTLGLVWGHAETEEVMGGEIEQDRYAINASYVLGPASACRPRPIRARWPRPVWRNRTGTRSCSELPSASDPASTSGAFRGAAPAAPLFHADANQRRGIASESAARNWPNRHAAPGGYLIGRRSAAKIRASGALRAKTPAHPGGGVPPIPRTSCAVFLGARASCPHVSSACLRTRGGRHIATKNARLWRVAGKMPAHPGSGAFVLRRAAGRRALAERRRRRSRARPASREPPAAPTR